MICCACSSAFSLCSAAASAVAVQAAVSAPGGLLEQLGSGEITQEQLMEQSALLPGFDGH